MKVNIDLDKDLTLRLTSKKDCAFPEVDISANTYVRYCLAKELMDKAEELIKKELLYKNDNIIEPY